MTPHQEIEAAWVRIMDATLPSSGTGPYPLRWPPPWPIGEADAVALSIAMFGGEGQAPYLWRSTRTDLDRRIGRARRWRLDEQVPLPPVAMWPDEARAWLVGRMLRAQTWQKVAESVPIALWHAAQRDRLAWQLRYEEGMSTREVGEILGITSRAVRYATDRHRDRS
jgi:DNA-directed RNA polymerase specialized sigma24 family protein